MRAAVLPVLVALLAAPVQAQASTEYHAILRLVPPEDPFTPSRMQASVEGQIDLTGDPTLLLDTEGVPVEYRVTNAPAWLTVVVSPATDVIPLTFSGPSVTGSRPFTVTMEATNPGEGDLAKVEITATVRPKGIGAPVKAVSEEMAVAFHLTPEDQREQTRRIARGDEPPAPQPGPSPAGPVAAPLRGPQNPALWMGAFALAGAGAGLLLARRARR